MKRIIVVFLICCIHFTGFSQMNLLSLEVESVIKSEQAKNLIPYSHALQAVPTRAEVCTSKKSFAGKYKPDAIHANIGIVNHPTITIEKDLLVHKTKYYNHLYASLGYSRLSFLRDSGNGIEAKIGGQYGILELNAGFWIPTKQVSSYVSQYGHVLPAFQLGLRSKSIKNNTIVRFGVGYPDGVYFGLGFRLGK